MIEKQDSKKRLKLSSEVDGSGITSLLVDRSDEIKAVETSGHIGSSSDTYDSSAAHFVEAAALSLPQPQVGALGLPARYEVIELLGEGGMAHVYGARDTADDGKLVAIKILRPEIVPDPSIVERFFREAKAAQKLSHRNLVSVYRYGTTESNMPYLIMEYVHGRNLAQIISEEKHLPCERAINIFVQICAGLNDAHKLGMVHRDLKPSNILIAIDDDGIETVKIADFGIAKPASSERTLNPDLTKTGAILGSPAYMSPEQCLGHVVDERSDIYSMGCLMYETLTGRSPFWADTPVKSLIRHLEEKPEPFEIEFKKLQIPKGLEATVMKCLEKGPANRFQRIEQLHGALTAPVEPGSRRRFGAELLDLLIVVFFVGVITGRPANSVALLLGLQPDTMLFGYVTLLMMMLSVIAYYGLFEASKFQATPGKLVAGLKVISKDGAKLNPWSTYLPALATMNIVVSLIYFSLIFCLFCFRIHNHWGKSFDLSFFAFIYASLIVMFPIFFSNGRRNLIDCIFDRYVACPVRASKPPNHKYTAKQVSITLLSFIAPLLVILFPNFYKQQYANPNLKKVVCVELSHHVQPGSVITRDMIVTVAAPPILVPQSAISDPNRVIGKRCLNDLPPYEAIKPSDLADADARDVRR